MLTRRHFLQSVGMGAAGAAIAGSPFPLGAFEPSRHGQVVGAKTALGTARSSAILLNSNENAYGPLPKAAIRFPRRSTTNSSRATSSTRLLQAKTPAWFITCSPI